MSFLAFIFFYGLACMIFGAALGYRVAKKSVTGYQDESGFHLGLPQDRDFDDTI